MEVLLVYFGIAAAISLGPFIVFRRRWVAFVVRLAGSLVLPAGRVYVLMNVVAGAEGEVWAGLAAMFAVIGSAPPPLAVDLAIRLSGRSSGA